MGHGEHIARVGLRHAQGGHSRAGDEACVIGQLARGGRHCNVDSLVSALVQREVVHCSTILLNGDGGVIHCRVGLRIRRNESEVVSEIAQFGGFIENVGNLCGVRLIPVHLLLHERAAAAATGRGRNGGRMSAVRINHGNRSTGTTRGHSNGR